MKRILLILSLMMTLLSACGAPAATALPKPAETLIYITAAPAEPDVTSTEAAPAVPVGKLPAAPFEAQTYINGRLGFALDYPASWTVHEVVAGERGTQVQFVSSPDLIDAATVPAGQTRVVATLYNWDPKNDLAAYVAQRKTAWETSGFTVQEEESLTLELGLAAVQLTVHTPEATVVYLIAALGDQYLVLSGEGDLELAKEIMQRVRPISR